MAGQEELAGSRREAQSLLSPPHFQSWPLFQYAGGCDCKDFTVPGFYLVFRPRIYYFARILETAKCRPGTDADPRIICSLALPNCRAAARLF
jgi:hypothetical protein